MNVPSSRWFILFDYFSAHVFLKARTVSKNVNIYFLKITYNFGKKQTNLETGIVIEIQKQYVETMNLL